MGSHGDPRALGFATAANQGSSIRSPDERAGTDVVARLPLFPQVSGLQALEMTTYPGLVDLRVERLADTERR